METGNGLMVLSGKLILPSLLFLYKSEKIYHTPFPCNRQNYPHLAEEHLYSCVHVRSGVLGWPRSRCHFLRQSVGFDFSSYMSGLPVIPTQRIPGLLILPELPGKGGFLLYLCHIGEDAF